MVTDDAGHGIYEEFDEIVPVRWIVPVDPKIRSGPEVPVAPIVPLCGEMTDK